MPESKRQVRWAHAVKEGAIAGDEKFASEVISKMHGHHLSELPEHAGKRRPRIRRHKETPHG